MKSALIVIDMQNDFCPGGALAVKGGNEIVSAINTLSQSEDFDTVVVTQDYHPKGHSSFASTHNLQPYAEKQMPYGNQTLWPDHCVQGTHGVEVVAGMEEMMLRADLVIRKGMNPNIDSYSAFFENDRTTATGLSGYLKDRGIEKVYLVGLAYDFCVGYSALDAVELGFKAVVIPKLCRAIGIPLNGLETTETLMTQKMEISGVEFNDWDGQRPILESPKKVVRTWKP